MGFLPACLSLGTLPHNSPRKSGSLPDLPGQNALSAPYTDEETNAAPVARGSGRIPPPSRCLFLIHDGISSGARKIELHLLLGIIDRCRCEQLPSSVEVVVKQDLYRSEIAL